MCLTSKKKCDRMNTIKEKVYDKPHLYNLVMPYELYELAKRKALSERRSLAEVVRELLRGWLDE